MTIASKAGYTYISAYSLFRLIKSPTLTFVFNLTQSYL
jgi:hypothetical protein